LSWISASTCCTIVLSDSGAVPDLARLMIRDCRYDVSLWYSFKEIFEKVLPFNLFFVECVIKKINEALVKWLQQNLSNLPNGSHRHDTHSLQSIAYCCVSVGRDSSMQRLLLSFQRTHERLVLSALCKFQL